jgi:hypothetical protein
MPHKNIKGNGQMQIQMSIKQYAFPQLLSHGGIKQYAFPQL